MIKEKCPHEDNCIYGELTQVDGEPQYNVSCGDCGIKGIIYLGEVGESWGEDMDKGREEMLNKSKQETPKLNSLYEKIILYGQPTWIVSSIAKEDLENYFTKKEIEKLTDEEMSIIAERMSDAISETSYWDCLEGVSEYIKEHTKCKHSNCDDDAKCIKCEQQQ